MGERASLAYRMYFRRGPAETISPWHEVPLFAGPPDGGVVHFINEIPRGCVAALAPPWRRLSRPNPVLECHLQHARQNGDRHGRAGQPDQAGREEGEAAVRGSAACDGAPCQPPAVVALPWRRDYPFDSLVNYGALPQTWEDPARVDPLTRYSGGSLPADPTAMPCRRLTPPPQATMTRWTWSRSASASPQRVPFSGCVLPSARGRRQATYVWGAAQVKVLGVLGMIDEGEMDWKVIAIDVEDPLAPRLQGERACPAAAVAGRARQ